MSEFRLHDVYVASRSQVLMRSNGKAIQVVDNFSEVMMSEILYGDSLRLQQVLADFMSVCVNLTPVGGHLGISVTLTKDDLGQSVQLVHLEFRYKQYLIYCIIVYNELLDNAHTSFQSFGIYTDGWSVGKIL